MKKIFRFLIAPLVLGSAVNVVSCDEDTSFVGMDIMPGGDIVSADTAVFNVNSRSVRIDSVLANTNDSYLGCIIDPETRAMTECGFLAQFHITEDYRLPEKKRMKLDNEGNVVADSCDLRIAFNDYYGDSLMAMKLNVRELDTARVMKENISYYTNYNPLDFIHSDGLKTSLVYTIKDLTRPDYETNGKKYLRSVIVRLPAEYGSYILNKYYENPSFFKNSYEFINHVCAGFYFNTIGSVGAMIKAEISTLNVYFSYHKNVAGKDTIIDGLHQLAATKEVIQNTRVENKIPESMLDENNAYTYLKTPTGIFTEVTLPVADIVGGRHYTDTINGAKIIFRTQNTVSDENLSLSPSSDLLMVRKSIATKFFEKNRLPKFEDSYLATYDAFSRTYEYGDIGPMLTAIKYERDKGAGVTASDNEEERVAKYQVWETENPDWNKVMLIPVKAEYSITSNIYGYPEKNLYKIRNAMGLNSARLEGGSSSDLKMTVVYSRFAK